MVGAVRGRVAAAFLGLALVAVPGVTSRGVQAASAGEIEAKVDLALDDLLARSPAARAVAEHALAVLVFPDIVKGGFGVGGQYGEGALRRGGVTMGYYSVASASFGFQIGAQSYAQALFFMSEDALDYLARVDGFELGADASVAIADEGLGVDVSSSTLQDPIVAFVFGQRGLMAGIAIEGSKITPITPR